MTPPHSIRSSFRRNALVTACLAFSAIAALVAGAGAAAARPEIVTGKRSTLAITYREGDGTSVEMIGAALRPGVAGKADVKRKDGRTRVKLEGFMRSAAMQKDRGAENRHLGDERRGANRPEKRPEHGWAFYSTKKQGGVGFVSRYGARTRA